MHKGRWLYMPWGLVIVLALVFLPHLAPAQQPEGPEIACDEASEPLLLTIGDRTTNCAIDDVTDRDRFTFEASAGDNLRISVRSLSFMDARLQISDPQNNEIFNEFCNGGCILQTDLSITVSGIYGVAVSDATFDESGSYFLHLERVSPDFTPPDISYDSSVNDTINFVTDRDFFTFEAVENTVVLVIVRSLSFMDPRLQISDPQNNEIFNQFCNGGCTLQATLPITAAGTYFLVLSDEGLDETGTYQINVQCLSGPCPVGRPDVSVAPASFNFGNVNAGFASAPQPFTIANHGTRNLVINNVSLSPAPALFGLLNDTCSGQTILPNGNCTVRVVFAPTSAALVEHTLTIFSNDPDTPALDVPLTGNGSGAITFGASVTAATPETVLCRNLATGQSVRITGAGRSFDCEAAGLTVNTNDEVLTAIRGRAD